MGFADMHGYADFAKMYKIAARLANPRQHRDFGKRILEVLDIQGGNGIMGSLLFRDLEGRLNYVNVDDDSNLLKQSPGNSILCDSNALSEKTGGRKFDYIFLLNQDSHVAVPYFANTDNPFSEYYVNLEEIKGITSRINELQVSVLLRRLGFFVFGGVITEHNIAAITSSFEKDGTGIVLVRNEQLGISDETARAFASYDLRRELRYKLDAERRYVEVSEHEIQNEIKQAVIRYKNIRIAAFQRSAEAKDPKAIEAELKRVKAILAMHNDNIAYMDMAN